jgi:23S rRNA pseudouridine2605 synthase
MDERRGKDKATPQKRSGQGRAGARRSRTPQPAPPAARPSEAVRLNRFIAQAGVCSRRKADELIAAGRVRVNGEVVTELGTRVMPEDAVSVNGRVLTPQGLVYVLLNKPGDTITTTDDERGRRTVLDLIEVPEADKQGLYPVGRLDRHTEGVLLLTNDGDLAHRLMHPRYEVEKLYVARTKTPVKPHELEALREGILLEDGEARADRVAYVSPERQDEVGLLLHEGRNRQVRRMFEALGHEVVHLERVRYAGLTVDGVRRGRWRRLHSHEIKRLRQLVKLKA